MLLRVEAVLSEPASLFDRDPAVFPEAVAMLGMVASMGHIVRTGANAAVLQVDAVGAVPIDRVDVVDGRTLLATIRGGTGDVSASRRVRVMWEGAEYRGRGRQTTWDGTAVVTGNHVARAGAVNFLNADNPLEQDGPDRLRWRSVTTGNMAGFDLWLDDATDGALQVTTPHVSAKVEIHSITTEDLVFEAGGLGRRLRIFRLPEAGGRDSVGFSLPVPLAAGRDTPVFVRVTQEDGHQAWSSPIYFIP